jgi:hypothetical protein
MKKYLMLFIVVTLIASCGEKHLHIRKIPCDGAVTFNNQGTLNGTYLQLFYAVDAHRVGHEEIIAAVRRTADSVFKATEKKFYSRVTCTFLEESGKLKEIKDCSVTDSHNVFSGEHKSILIICRDKNGKSEERL